MSADYQKSVTFAIMSAKLEGLRDDVRALWAASQDQSQTETQRAANVDQILYHAWSMLPENLKPDAHKSPKPKGGFDDILG
ncbi:hypothetical protein [Rhizobium nepotum]|uniref:hypothetical protein n=1 Tax=Rhizobium nepotum TaxID=1035271 RepID=UPI003CF9381D